MKKIMFNDKYWLTEAVLNGKKTQTRRFVNLVPPIKVSGKQTTISAIWWDNSKLRFYWKDDFGKVYLLPKKNFHKYKIGEIVAIAQKYSEKDVYEKYLNKHPEEWSTEAGWNNKMFVKADMMPHQIKITDVRLEHLHDISDADCLAEGIYEDSFEHDEWSRDHFYDFENSPQSDFDGYKTPREAYAALIDKINGKGTWKSNPWVWVYEFKLIN